MKNRPSPCIRYACSQQSTYSAGVTRPIISVLPRISVLRLGQFWSLMLSRSLLTSRRADPIRTLRRRHERDRRVANHEQDALVDPRPELAAVGRAGGGHPASGSQAPGELV